MPDAEWSVGYGTTTTVDGFPLVATWGGGSYSPDAVARVGRLMLHKGTGKGRRLVSPSVVETVTKHSGMPGHSGLGWWVNSAPDGSQLWKSAPEDAFGGAGAGQQFLLIVPSLDLIVVRNGEQLDPTLAFEEGLDRYVVAPVVRAISTTRKAQVDPDPRGGSPLAMDQRPLRGQGIGSTLAASSSVSRGRSLPVPRVARREASSDAHAGSVRRPDEGHIRGPAENEATLPDQLTPLPGRCITTIRPVPGPTNDPDIAGPASAITATATECTLKAPSFLGADQLRQG